MQAIELVAKERQRQIDVEGYSLDNDLKLENNELVQKALYYLSDNFPASDKALIEKKQNKCKLRRLVVAASLIVAEIDRLQNSCCNG